MTRIEIVESRLHNGVQYRAFIARDGDKYVRFSLWNDSPVLGSFGGSHWPNEFPDVFEHFGDPGVINCRSGYLIKAAALDAMGAA